MSDNVIEIDNLRVFFDTEGGEARAVDGLTLTMERGRILAIVGESGCGKSVTAYSILRLIQRPGEIMEGSRIVFRPKEGEPIDICSLREDDERLYGLRGGKISMIFQEPMTALSPVHTIGNQICEAILLHQDVNKAQARRAAIDMLTRVGIPGPEKRIDQYPFEMSGGMCQRVVIAMAMACKPELLIADEPTTALDVTIQAQIMGLMRELKDEMDSSVIVITHDLGVVAQMADDVAVMYLGQVVEQAPVVELMTNPRHPYTLGLLRSLPSLHLDRDELPSIKGSVPSLTDKPSGCPFHPRCEFAREGLCDTGPAPRPNRVAENRFSACLREAELPIKDLISDEH